MDLYVDKYAHLNTPLHRWDPRCKLVALVALVFSFSFVQDITFIPMMLAISTFLYILSGLPLNFLTSRLRLPGIFLLILLMMLPFMSGHQVLFVLGPLSVKAEGCLDALLIGSKFIAIITTVMVLFGTTPFLVTVKAMQALGLPTLLADITLFAYRYLFEIQSDLRTMQRAMRLRGFKNGSHSIGMLAALTGTILVHSYEQSERVFKAMILRGYGQPSSYREDFDLIYQPGRVGLAVSVLVSVTFVAAQLLIKKLPEVLT